MELPNGDYNLQVDESNLEHDGRSYWLVQHCTISSGPFIGRRLRVRTPITQITGTVSFEAGDWPTPG